VNLTSDLVGHAAAVYQNQMLKQLSYRAKPVIGVCDAGVGNTLRRESQEVVIVRNQHTIRSRCKYKVLYVVGAFEADVRGGGNVDTAPS
jgi:hypothetical protein